MNDNNINEMSDTVNNFNISPEMITNLLNNFKESSSESKSSNNNSNESSLGSNSSNNNSDESSTNIDFDTILKIKSIMDNLNKKDDPRAKLLYSLKPYLRESRKKKIDQYVNLLKIANISNLFKNEKGDAK